MPGSASAVCGSDASGATASPWTCPSSYAASSSASSSSYSSIRATPRKSSKLILSSSHTSNVIDSECRSATRPWNSIVSSHTGWTVL